MHRLRNASAKALFAASILSAFAITGTAQAGSEGRKNTAAALGAIAAQQLLSGKTNNAIIAGAGAVVAYNRYKDAKDDENTYDRRRRDRYSRDRREDRREREEFERFRTRGEQRARDRRDSEFRTDRDRYERDRYDRDRYDRVSNEDRDCEPGGSRYERSRDRDDYHDRNRNRDERTRVVRRDRN